MNRANSYKTIININEKMELNLFQANLLGFIASFDFLKI